MRNWGQATYAPKYLGSDPVRENDGIGGRGIGKKQMSVCNGVNRGSEFALTRKGADPTVTVFCCMNGGKPVNVSSSITPLIGERLADIRSNLQWNNIDWKIAEKYVNRLQTRITKAVKKLLPWD